LLADDVIAIVVFFSVLRSWRISAYRSIIWSYDFWLLLRSFSLK